MGWWSSVGASGVLMRHGGCAEDTSGEMARHGIASVAADHSGA